MGISKKINHNEDFRIIIGETIEENKKYRESRKRWEKYSLMQEVAPSPLHVDIELTNLCDLDCIMCERKLMRRPKGMMSMELFKQIIQECNDIGVDSVKLNMWGESFLHKQIIDMISYAKENSSLILQFNTNANKMTPIISSGLIKCGLDRITISVDGITKEVYEKIRRGGNYERVIANVHELLRIKREMNSRLPYITLQIIRMTENEEEITDFINYWKDKVDYVSVTNIGATTDNQRILSLSLRKGKKKNRIPCVQLWQRLSIFWDGTITVCCNDFNGFLGIGKIGKNTLINLWHGEKLSELRNRHKKLDFNNLVCNECIETFKFEPC